MLTKYRVLSPSSVKGVSKYGDAWAQLAQRQQETGVVVVDESDLESDLDDDYEEDGGDDGDFGGGESCEDEEPYASAPAAGVASNAKQKQQEKREDNTNKKKEKKKKKNNKKGDTENKKLGLGRILRCRDLRWDEGEHRRFVEVGIRSAQHWRREMKDGHRNVVENTAAGGGAGLRGSGTLLMHASLSQGAALVRTLVLGIVS